LEEERGEYPVGKEKIEAEEILQQILKKKNWFCI